MAMDARKVARGTLVAVTITITAIGGVTGWLATRGDSSSEFVPWPEASIAVDAAIDAPAEAGSTDWVMVTIHGPESAVGLDGADGVDYAIIGGKLTVISPWEQSGTVSISTHTGPGAGTWSTVTVSTVFNVEDAKFCDVDRDGNLDVMGAGQGKRIRIWFGPTPFTTSVEIDAATNLQEWMQIACTTPTSKTFTADAGTNIVTASAAHGWSTGDLLRMTTTGSLPGGLSLATDYFAIRLSSTTFSVATNYTNAVTGSNIDITSAGSGTHTAAGGMRVWAGGRGTGASVGYFYSGDPRTSSAWTHVSAATAGWVMSLIPGDHDSDGDLDILWSDRNNDATAKGSTWARFESDGDGAWTKVRIHASNNEGDPKFLEKPDANTVLVGMSSSTKPNLVKKSVTSNNWVSFTTTTLAPNGSSYPSNTGQYQGITSCDTTGDGTKDYVLTHSSATGSQIGVALWNGASGEATSIDLASGEKYDNAVCYDVDGDGDLDVITSEQNEGRGVIYFRNPRI